MSKYGADRLAGQFSHSTQEHPFARPKTSQRSKYDFVPADGMMSVSAIAHSHRSVDSDAPRNPRHQQALDL